jgi:hypothetical protein
MMEIKRCLAVSLAMWLVFAALVGTTVNALPNHVVAGGVFGPGNDKSPGPANPANAVGMVFYSTNQPLYTLITGPDSFTPADGTDPAVFARDVGNIWDWLDGDEMVTVYETTQGVGLWTGGNYTTSNTTILHTGASVQDIGDTTLEPFPVVTLLKGADWVLASWSPLIDAGSNVQSYQLYRAPTPADSFVVIGTIVDAPGVKSFNDTGLSMGPVCYQLSVNYRRDNVGVLYETVGRSAMVCTVITGAPPYVLSTSPANNDLNVPLAANIVVTFSEPMNTGTVTYPITPFITLTPVWSIPNTVLTLTHATPFTQCQSYRVDLTGQDMDGNDLVPTPTTWSFTALCDLPFIVTTSPASGAQQVRLTTNIVITFSEAMDTPTVTYPIVPAVQLTAVWTTPGNMVLTLTHSTTPFTSGTSYQVTVTGKDMDGNDLIAGPVPNPWTFTTNNPPTADLDPSDTLVGICCTGGSGLAIPWTMSDIETPVGQLIVWLNYTMGVTTGTIAGPLTNRLSSDSYTWTTPIANESVTIWLEVIDGAGDSAQDSSASVNIDSTPPHVQSVIPSEGLTNVPTDAQVVITFSEPMQKPTVVVSFTPTVLNVQLAWDATNTTATVAHAIFQVSTLYTVTVDATAKDACTPGSEMGTANTTTFTTGTGPKMPRPPTNLAVSSVAYNQVVLTWTATTQYTDGSALTVAHYNVYRATSSTGAKASIGTPTSTTFTDTNVEQEKTYYYWVTAVNATSIESDYSNEASTTIPKQPTEGEFPWIWIIVVLIVILLVIGIILLMRRKKPEEALPEPIEGEEAPPESEAAPEEAPPEEAPPEETSEATPEEKPGGQ